MSIEGEWEHVLEHLEVFGACTEGAVDSAACVCDVAHDAIRGLRELQVGPRRASAMLSRLGADIAGAIESARKERR